MFDEANEGRLLKARVSEKEDRYVKQVQCAICDNPISLSIHTNVSRCL
jgi:hypothetical protein